jgi:hypothetical protein
VLDLRDVVARRRRGLVRAPDGQRETDGDENSGERESGDPEAQASH